MELCEVFARCGLDVLLITVANAALAILLKRTLLKKRPKAVTAMCFIAGGLIYAVYHSIAAADALYAFENLSAVAQKALTIGTLTLALCAAADKFTGGGGEATAADVVTKALDGVVESEQAAACAQSIVAAAENLEGDELVREVTAIIGEHGGQCTDALAAMIAQTAAQLTAVSDGAEEGKDN